MTRTNAREIAIHFIFELGFSTVSAQEFLETHLSKEHFSDLGEEVWLYSQFPNKKQADYIRDLVEGAHYHSPVLDQSISKYAKGWTFARIPRVIAAIMRVAMYEAMYMPDIPYAAAINDAVKIAKGYDDPEVISFMNGILGTFVREECGVEGKSPKKPEKLLEELFDEEEVESEEEMESQEEVSTTSATLEKKDEV